MVVVVLLVGLLAATATGDRHGDAPPPPPPGRGGPTLDEAKALLDVVEHEKFELFDDLSTITTLCSVVAGNLDEITDRFNPVIEDRNRQQDGLIAHFSEQLKGIQHRSDAAMSTVMLALSLARDTAEVIDEQADYISGPQVVGKQEEQQDAIDSLREDLQQAKETVLEGIAVSIDSILDVGDATSQLLSVDSQVNARRCEYGTGTFEEGEHDIEFQTTFTSTPVVTLQVVGFTAHLDGQFYDNRGYHKIDVLGLDKYLDYVNEDGFGLKLVDNTEGSVALKTVSCSWSACQSLDETVSVDTS